MKKKLIAAVTSLVMVATMVPATVSATVKPDAAKSAVTKAAESEAVTAAKAAIEAVAGKVADQDTQINYESGTALNKAKTLYDNLSANDKAALGDDLASRLNVALALYKGYTDKIAEVEAAISAVTTLQKDDETTEGTAYKKALDAYKETVAEVSKENVDSQSGKITAAEMNNDALKAALSKTATAKMTDAAAAYTVVTAIDGEKEEITQSNYTTKDLATVKGNYNNLTAAQQELVGNYGVIVKMENDIAAYKKAVADLTALNTEDYKAGVNGTITDKNIDKVIAAVAAVKEAFNKLDAGKQAAVDTATSNSINATKIETAEGNIKKYQDGLAAKAEAQPVIDMIKALKAPTSITIEDGQAIQAARAAYDALSVEAQSIVQGPTNYVTVLEAAEKAYTAVVQGESDTVRVEKLKKMVAALPSANAVTVENEAAIMEAMNYFNNNTSGATLGKDGKLNSDSSATTWQKFFVMGEDTTIVEAKATADYLKLKACIEVLKTKTDAEVKAAETFKTDYLAKLNIYNGSYIGTNTTKLANAKTLLANAKEAFNKLTVREQKLVEKNHATEYAYLKKTEDEIAASEKLIEDTATAAKIDELITAIGLDAANKLTAVNLSQYESKINAANEAYTAVNAEAKALVKNATLLNELVEKVKDLKSGDSVAAVEAAIAKLPIVKTDGTETEESLTAAQKQIKETKALFEGLTSNAQGTVKNAGRLASAEKALNEAALKLAQDEFAKIGNITSGITDEQIAQFNRVAAIVKAFEVKTTSISGYDTVKAAVEAKNTAALKAVEDAIKALPDTIAKKDIADVTAAKAAYDKLGADLQKEVDEKLVAKLNDAVKQADALSLAKATVSVEKQTYTGEALEPAVTVTDANGKAIAETEYDVVYKNNTAVGTAQVTIYAAENSKYDGVAKGSFEIEAAEVKAADVTGVVSKTYTGKALTQKVVVKANGKTLKNGTDYTVSYKNNTAVGKAAVTVKAKGNYTGTITKTFIVKPAKESITSLKKGTKRFTVKYKKQTGAKYQIYYKTAGSKAKTVKTSAVTKTVKNLKKGKTYTVKVRAYKAIDGKTYYGAYSAAKKVKVR